MIHAAVGNKTGVISIRILVFDYNSHFGIDGKQRRKRNFSGIIIDDVIVVFATFFKNSVHIHSLRTRNHQNIQLAIIAAQFVRSLIAFLTGKSTFGILPTHQSGRNKDFGFVIFVA